MSDQATVVAPTPESTTAPVQPEGQTLDTQAAPQAEGPTRKPVTRKDAYRAMQERLAKSTEAPAAEAARTEGAAPVVVVDEKGRKHDPQTGKFLAENGQEVNPPAAEGGTGETAGATAAQQPQRARIPLPEALRQQGRDFIEVEPAEEEIYRALTNGYTRTRAVEEAQARLVETEQRLMRLQAEQEVRSKMFSGPEYQQAMAKINAVRAVDPEAAALMERGLERDVTEKANSRFDELSRQQWGEQVRDAGNQTESQAWQMVSTRYPMEWLNSPAGRQVWQTATQMYVAEAQQALRPGTPPQFNPQRIVEIADFYAIRDPWMRDHLTGRMRADQEAKLKAERERIKAEEAEAAKKREAEALQQTAQKRSTMHPFGKVSSVDRSDRQSVSPGEPALSDVPVHLRRKTARERAIQRAGGL